MRGMAGTKMEVRQIKVGDATLKVATVVSCEWHDTSIQCTRLHAALLLLRPFAAEHFQSIGVQQLIENAEVQRRSRFWLVIKELAKLSN